MKTPVPAQTHARPLPAARPSCPRPLHRCQPTVPTVFLQGDLDLTLSPAFLPRSILKGFSADARDLSAQETKTLLAAGDKDGDGKIGVDGE